MNWAKIAAQAATDIQEQMLNVRRGAVAWRHGGLAIAFGNDGYEQDERTSRAVSWLRYHLPKHSAPVLGQGLSDDGFTWSLVVRTSAIDWLNQLVWRAWGEANPLDALAWRGEPAVCPPVHWTGAYDITTPETPRHAPLAPLHGEAWWTAPTALGLFVDGPFAADM